MDEWFSATGWGKDAFRELDLVQFKEAYFSQNF